MNTLKGWITTLVLVGMLAMTTTSANAGVIIAGLSDSDSEPCKEETTTTNGATLDGTLIVGLTGTGVIIAGFVGVIIAGLSDDSQETCGVIIAG